ncbi:hypothetical protein CesoFtcFv8_022946 [Champsocephalus esox]|uniref:Uncharacterized protein n=1 Tax=Champsocephalus esox TaxID=159716 RepID=A0AAN8B793_9TELE|nr:hypothetical protein CesoFtcFv8_022946 [Champsocephalus esox]
MSAPAEYVPDEEMNIISPSPSLSSLLPAVGVALWCRRWQQQQQRRRCWWDAVHVLGASLNCKGGAAFAFKKGVFSISPARGSGGRICISQSSG